MKPSLSDYRQFLAGVKNRVLDARIQAGRAINRELVQLYWDIGRGIVEKQRESGWGNSVVERFAADLRAPERIFAEIETSIPRSFAENACIAKNICHKYRRKRGEHKLHP